MTAHVVALSGGKDSTAKIGRIRKPDDWRQIERLAVILRWVGHPRAKAYRRLARRWQRLDYIEWFCT